MKVLAGFTFCLLLIVSFLSELTESRKLHLGNCAVSVHTNELRKYYNEIRTNVIGQDSEIGVRFLNRQTLKNVQEGQRCCFLHLLLRFYIERVFSGYTSSGPHDQRSASALANAFFKIRRDLRGCNCQCEEDTHNTIDSLQSEFITLDIGKAAMKAVGELDTLLDWLEGFNFM